MDITEAAKPSFIGQVGAYAITKELSIDVEIKDVRRGYGRIDFKITPVAGSGETWVSEKKVTIRITQNETST